MKRKLKKCKICGKEYLPFSSMAKVCSTACAITLVNQDNAKKVVKQVKARVKAEKAEHRRRKESIKPKAKWLVEVQTEFNKFIRLRDTDKPCISCGTLKPVQYCGGHFKTVGGHPELRFEELNVHKQCNKYCNLELSGNIHGYRQRLIWKIGIEKVEWLEGPHEAKHYTIDDLKELKMKYRKKWKELESEVA